MVKAAKFKVCITNNLKQTLRKPLIPQLNFQNTLNLNSEAYIFKSENSLQLSIGKVDLYLADLTLSFTQCKTLYQTQEFMILLKQYIRSVKILALQTTS